MDCNFSIKSSASTLVLIGRKHYKAKGSIFGKKVIMNFRCNTQGKQTLFHLWSIFQQLLTTAHRRGDVVQKRIKLQTADHLQAAFTLQALGRQIQCVSEGLQGSTDVVQSQIGISEAQKRQGL